jgi:dsDNA-specific endonuclease/ATPase MutS2
LKALAESDERFRNAGMEYDLMNLRPTFRLKDGVPGRSYASISRLASACPKRFWPVPVRS